MDLKSKPKFYPYHDSKLMDQVREVLQYYHLGNITHQKLLGAKNIQAVFSHLANEGMINASTPWFSFTNKGWTFNWKMMLHWYAAIAIKVRPHGEAYLRQWNVFACEFRMLILVRTSFIFVVAMVKNTGLPCYLKICVMKC